jgi:uncharacterized protein YhbP (UPF0306 family)
MKSYGYGINSMKNLLSEKIKKYLQNHNVATIAASAGDELWAAAVFYVSEGYEIFFLSSPATRHMRIIDKSPRIALTIQEDYSDWLDIKGIQLEGVVYEIAGEEAERAYKIYAEKFPVVSLLSKAPMAIACAMSKICWYKVVPQRLYFIDNSLGLGHREEINLYC